MIETTIGIDGMMCDMCEAHINDAIRKHFSVKSAKANRRKKCCTVVSENPLDETEMRRVIAQTGYDFLSFESRPYQKKGFLGMFRG